MSDLLSSPAVTGIIVGIPSLILGILAFIRSIRVDNNTEESQDQSKQVTAINQVIEGQNQIIINLQEDNRLLRLDINDCKKQITDLSKEVRDLNKRHNPT